MHQKINIVPKTWAIARSGRKFVVRSTHMQRQGIPLLVAMRDILNTVANRRELKIALRDGKIKINGKIVKNDKLPLSLMSILSFGNKHYRVLINERGKFAFKEISANDTNEIIFRVIGKKILKKGKKQFNLLGGHNIISDKDISVGDSIILDIEKNDIKKILKLDKNSQVFVIGGKYMGKTGIIKDIDKGLAKIEGKGIHINVNLDKIMAVEK